ALAGDVEGREETVAARRPDLGLERLALGLEHVADDDARALASEQPRLRGAHAARPATDECDLAGQSHVVLPCSRLRWCSAWRTASPTKFNPTTVMNRAAPGPKTIQGACCR